MTLLGQSAHNNFKRLPISLTRIVTECFPVDGVEAADIESAGAATELLSDVARSQPAQIDINKVIKPTNWIRLFNI